MNILVTGGAGFIGNQFILRARGLGHTVTCVDVVNDYYDPKLKEDRLRRLDDTVKIHRIDIADKVALEKIFEAEKFDKICHFAAQAGVRYSLLHPDLYVQSNYVGTFNLIDLAHKYGIDHVISASTSSAYGKTDILPFEESDKSDKPMSIYAATKRGAELLGYSYHSLFGLNTTFLRFFSVYGPWGRPDMAFFLFTKGIIDGTPITVFNDGNMLRDFTYVDDIVEGFVKALDQKLGFEIINIGRGSTVNLNDFITVIEKEVGKKAIRESAGMQPGDAPVTYADVSKAKKLLGFEAKVDVEEGVKNFVKWYRDYYHV